MKVFDSLMELLLKNELYTDKKSLNVNEEDNEKELWNKYFTRHRYILSTKQIGMILEIKSV